MAYCYRPVDRSQRFLLPPDMADWLPEGHLAWLVIEVVDRLDTSLLHAGHGDGVGRRGYDPDMLLALLVYSYCSGVRSSRQIERLCQVDVAYRVICANDGPDHTTIARFRQRHETAAQKLFVDVLAICAKAGMAQVGVVAVDGTKMAANASVKANRSMEQIRGEVAAMFAQAEGVDVEEDRRLGSARGDELPGDLGDRRRRAARLEVALRQLEAEEAARRAEEQAERVKAEEAAEEGRGLPGRPKADAEVTRAAQDLARLDDELASPDSALRRAEADLAAKTAAAEAAEIKKLTVRGNKNGRPRKSPGGQGVARALAKRNRQVAVAQRRRRHALARLAKARARAAERQANPSRGAGAQRANVTDPDSRLMKSPSGWVQGYNAQAAVNAQGIVVAATVTQEHNDVGQCVPMISAVADNLAGAGIDEPVGTMLFDAGYLSEANLTAAGPDRLIATAKTWKLRRQAKEHGYARGDPPPDANPVEVMEHRLRTQAGAALYGMRQHTVEPVFGHTKHNRGYTRFLRRGRAAVQAEWQLMMTAHNLVKLHLAGWTPSPTT